MSELFSILEPRSLSILIRQIPSPAKNSRVISPTESRKSFESVHPNSQIKPRIPFMVGSLRLFFEVSSLQPFSPETR